MIERGRGHLLNVASIGAYTPTPMFATYTATKAYVRNLTEAIAYELRGTGVHATCVNPGPTKTEFMDHANQITNKTAELFMMSSQRCAEIAVEGMLAARPNVITGWLNAVAMWLLRFVPRSLYPTLSHRAMSRGVRKA
jgi:short-subunit dehydrogenase